MIDTIHEVKEQKVKFLMIELIYVVYPFSEGPNCRAPVSHGQQEAWKVEAGKKLKQVEDDHAFQNVADVLEKLCSVGVLEMKKRGKRASSYRWQPVICSVASFSLE